jgi:hypothetical protein
LYMLGMEENWGDKEESQRYYLSEAA